MAKEQSMVWWDVFLRDTWTGKWTCDNSFRDEDEALRFGVQQVEENEDVDDYDIIDRVETRSEFYE